MYTIHIWEWRSGAVVGTPDISRSIGWLSYSAKDLEVTMQHFCGLLVAIGACPP